MLLRVNESLLAQARFVGRASAFGAVLSILGVTRDNRMVLCELPLNHSFRCHPSAKYFDYIPIEEIEKLEQEKRSA